MTDILILIIIALFALLGFRKGFAKTVWSAATTLVSIILGTALSRPIAIILYNRPLGSVFRNMAEKIIATNESLIAVNNYGAGAATEYIAMTICSVISFILIAVVVRVIAGLLAGSAKLVSKLPVVKQANALLGLVFGIVFGALLCYTGLGVIRALNLSGVIENGGFVSNIESSVIGSVFYFNNAVANALSHII